MTERRYYAVSTTTFSDRNPVWDCVALSLVIGTIVLFAWGTLAMNKPYHFGEPIPISLDPWCLFGYGARTVLRLFIAMFFSVLFTLTIGTWAAKSRSAERILIPMIDILQSVPVLSFLSITVLGFIALFPGSLLGPECCVIFAIFTAQAWNMILSFYQSLHMIPQDLKEVAKAFRLSAWQQFWRIELPFAMPALLWNSMMSMSSSWFFLVIAEAISVANQDIRLPGIGSYIQLAIDNADVVALLYAIFAMFMIILLYDQLIFRPLIAWSEKFKFSQVASEIEARSWLLDGLQKTHIFHFLNKYFGFMTDYCLNFMFRRKSNNRVSTWEKSTIIRIFSLLTQAFVFLGIGLLLYFIFLFIARSFSIHDVITVFILGLVTALRVFAVILLSSLVWVPIGVLIGLRPGFAVFLQPIIQFLAAFPANLFYPLAVLGILYYQLDPQIWLTPLMILGAQWYILFNVIAGAATIPKDLTDVADNFSVKRWCWWKRLVLPAIFPYYVTGALTAAGGAWNASIVVEWVSWGNTTLKATGLGEYIHEATVQGHFPAVVLGTTVMCILVLIFNHLVWRPLYRFAETHFRFV